jgi:hypothetical protein
MESARFIVPLPGRRSLSVPLFCLRVNHRPFPVQDLQSMTRIAPLYFGDKSDHDDGDGDSMPEIFEEKDFDEEDDEGEATLEPWIEVLAHEFIVLVVEWESRAAADAGDWNHEVVVVWRVRFHLLRPRSKKLYSQDVERVARVFDRLVCPRPRD